MAKSRSPNRDKAFEIFINHRGNITNREIAKILDEKISNISSWKRQDKWKEKIPPKKKGGQEGNINALKHGLYCNDNKISEKEHLKKYLSTAKKNIMNSIASDGIVPEQLLKELIVQGYADLIRSDKVMQVKNSKDITKILKKTSEGDKSYSKEFEIQTALDKQATALKAKAATMQALNNLIKQYNDCLHDVSELDIEERKLRIDKLKAEIAEITGDVEEEKSDDGFISALNGTAEEDWSDEEI